MSSEQVSEQAIRKRFKEIDAVLCYTDTEGAIDRLKNVKERLERKPESDEIVERLENRIRELEKDLKIMEDSLGIESLTEED